MNNQILIIIRVVRLRIILFLISTITVFLIAFTHIQSKQIIHQQKSLAVLGTNQPNLITQIEQSILTNIKQNGYNLQTNGLYINWVYGTNPLQTNFNGTGQPDGSSVTPPRHDPLTDLRYLHNLWLYTAQNPSDTLFASELQRYTAIIKSEFATAHDAQRGWEYDEEFTDLYALSHDSFYQQQMQNLATAYANSINKTAGNLF